VLERVCNQTTITEQPATTAPATIFDDGKKKFWAAWSAIVT
jgi:hypothetical protein